MTFRMDAFTVDLMVNEAREADLVEKLRSYNGSHSPFWDENHDKRFIASPLHLFVVDADERMMGGLVGRTHGIRCWFEISLLWVDEKFRGRGLGRELLTQAEKEAVRRGCLYARLSTSHYQAPGFYDKMGYILYGKLDNCPPGDTVYYFRRTLVEQENEKRV